MTRSNDMGGRGPRWGNRNAERRANTMVVAALVAIVLISLLLWWLILTDLGTLIWLSVAAGIVMLVADIAVRARRKLRVRRQKRDAKEDWPRATVREHDARVERSPDQEN